MEEWHLPSIAGTELEVQEGKAEWELSASLDGGPHLAKHCPTPPQSRLLPISLWATQIPPEENRVARLTRHCMDPELDLGLGNHPGHMVWGSHPAPPQLIPAPPHSKHYTGGTGGQKSWPRQVPEVPTGRRWGPVPGATASPIPGCPQQGPLVVST